jgi:hypothetical protein
MIKRMNIASFLPKKQNVDALLLLRWEDGHEEKICHTETATILKPETIAQRTSFTPTPTFKLS